MVGRRFLACSLLVLAACLSLASVLASAGSSPATRPSALGEALRAHLRDATNQVATPSDTEDSLALHVEDPPAHSQAGALRRRSSLLRKYGRLDSDRLQADSPHDAASLRLFGLGDSVRVDALDVDEEDLDALEWKVAKQHARLDLDLAPAEPKARHFQVQSTSTRAETRTRQRSLAPTDNINDALGGLATSAPSQSESHSRAKTADLQLPSSQISAIVLSVKQHIIWLIASLRDHLPQSGVDAFPKPTRNELYGYVYSLYIDSANPNSWLDSLSNDFDDMLLLQIWQYRCFQGFFSWIQISTVLYAFREETNYPLSPIQKSRLWTRYTGLFREDLNVINLGEEGELRRFATWKWQLEMVGEVLSEASTEIYVAHLLDLAASLRAQGIREGLIRYYQSMFIEKLAKFRLDYTYDAAVEYFDTAYDAIMRAARIDEQADIAGIPLDERDATARGRGTYDPNAWKKNLTAVQLGQIDDMQLILPRNFDPLRVPINVLTLVDLDLVTLQAPAIESIRTYLLYHAKVHGNDQDEIDATDGDVTSLDSLTAGGGIQAAATPDVAPVKVGLTAAQTAQLRLRARAAAAEAAAQVDPTQGPSSYSFRDISQSDADGYLGGAQGFVEQQSESRDDTEAEVPQSARIGAFLAAAQSREDRAAFEAAERARLANSNSFVEYRAQKEAPQPKGREKHFITKGEVDMRGFKRVQPLAYTPPASKRAFRTMSTGGQGEPAAPECGVYSLAEHEERVSPLRVRLLAESAQCVECVHPATDDGIATLVAEMLPFGGVDACTWPILRSRAQAAVSAVIYLQQQFLLPYGRATQTPPSDDDVDFLFPLALQVAQHSLVRDDRSTGVWVDSSAFQASDHTSLTIWCALMLQVARTHPRTRSVDGTVVDPSGWRSLIPHVNEMLGWSWYTEYRSPAQPATQPAADSRDLRRRHTTHVGYQLVGIDVEMSLIMDTFADSMSAAQSNHTSAYTSGQHYSRVLMSADPLDRYTDAYGGLPTEDQLLLDVGASSASLRAREQLLFLIERNNITLSSFDVDGFLARNSVAAFQVLSERLRARLVEVYSAYRLDAGKSWHSDRSKSPSASYDFDPAIKGIDFAVWLDAMCYHPIGHLGLDMLAIYTEESVSMINKKVSADDKTTREMHLRHQVAPAIWLKDVAGFERWRWSWSYPDAKKLLTPDQVIVFNWLESWFCSSNLNLGAMTAIISSTIWSLLQVMRYLITKPWCRSTLIRTGTMHYEQLYHEEYERRERAIILWRILPIQIVVTYCSNFMLVTFVLALNFSFFNPLAMLIYLAIFRWLTTIIFDVYAVKFFIYLVLFLSPKLRTGDLKPPLCPCSIPLSSSIVLLNPLRPANDDQLRQAVKKQIDLLWAAASQHIVAVLILQAEGNSTKTFRRYETIVRQLLYDDPDVPQHVKDRFFVFHVAEVTKPHNMFKVMHWLFSRSEIYDPVTRGFLFGIDTAATIARCKRVIRRVPFGLKPPVFCSLGGPSEGSKLIDQIEANGIETIDDQDMIIGEAAKAARAIKEEKEAKAQKEAAIAVVEKEELEEAFSMSMLVGGLTRDAKPHKYVSLAERWKNYALGGPESTWDPEEADQDAERKAKRPRKMKVAKASDPASRTRTSHLMPNDDDFPDELHRSDADVSDEENSDWESSDEEKETAAAAAVGQSQQPAPASSPIKAKFHSTYEPLVYLGGDLEYRGVSGVGADCGILCTVQGLRNLAYLRNESKPGEPRLENFAVLDADNYIEPVTLLRMLATMDDSHMIWQLAIKFWNKDQSAYAYMKDFTNEHAGNFMNVANTWMYGGVRTAGKYFGRLKRFYYEECTAASCATAPDQYSFLFNLSAGMLTVCMILICIRPLGEWLMWVMWIIAPLLTIVTCAILHRAHRKLRQDAFDVSKLSDPNIGKGEDLQGFGPVHGDDVFAAASNDAGAHRRRGHGGRRVGVGLSLGDSRKVASRFQNAFPLNRLFIQSEDARHGGPFGRAVALIDDAIYESTPISPLDDNHREFSKWLPTFDMRDFLLLHTPLLWILQHLTVSVWLLGLTAIGLGVLFAFSFFETNLPSSLAQVGCFVLFVCALGLWYAFYSIKQAMTEPVLLALRASRFPELPERALYAEDLMIRGIWSETIWLMQFVLGIFCLLVPGTIETAFPFLGEFHLMILLVLLIHPKFSAPLLTRLHYVIHPKWKGYWRTRQAIAQANEHAKEKGIKILLKKSKKHLAENAGYKESDHQIVSIDEDGEQIVVDRATSSTITADELYALSQKNSLSHTTLFETGKFHVCGRNLPKWNKSSHLAENEKYSKLKDEDGFVKDTRFEFRLPALEECGRKLDLGPEAFERKEAKLKAHQAVVEERRKHGVDVSGPKKVAFPLGGISEDSESDDDDDDASAASSPKKKKPSPKQKAKKPKEPTKPGMVAFPLGAASSSDSSSDSDSAAEAEEADAGHQEDHPSIITFASSSSSSSDDDAHEQADPPVKAAGPAKGSPTVPFPLDSASPTKVPFPLEAPVYDLGDVEEEAKIHHDHLLERAQQWNSRQYVIYREKRLQPLLRLSFWLIHDVPLGVFEFVASTTVFGLKLLVKPPQVFWAMVGCCMEIKGLLNGIPTRGTWDSFVESSETMPLSAYIYEYHVPMSVSLILFFLCLPSLPGLVAQSPVFSNPYLLALFGTGFGALLGLYPAWVSWSKLKPIVRNKSAGGWSQLNQLRNMREFWSLVCSLLLFSLVVFFSFSSWLLRGSFPAVFFIRSFPILIASFVLGPGIAWLLGSSHGVLDTSVSPPRYKRATHTMLLCVGVGLFVLTCAAMFVFSLARVLLPLQRALGSPDAGLNHSAGQMSTGDGAVTIVLPMSLTWYFLIPFSSIVFGSLLLAAIAWPLALGHQVWTWYTSFFRGGKAETRVKIYKVDDVKQNQKERKENFDRLEKSGASRALIDKLAKDGDLGGDSAASSSSASEAAASSSPADRPLIDGARGAGIRAVNPKRRGAVTLAI